MPTFLHPSYILFNKVLVYTKNFHLKIKGRLMPEGDPEIIANLTNLDLLVYFTDFLINCYDTIVLYERLGSKMIRDKGA